MGSRILVLLVVAVARAADETVISVQLTGGPEVATPPANWAKSQAGEIFRAAGVRLEWCESAKKCRHWGDRIVLTLESRAPFTLPYYALAAAQVFEGRNIRIYLDRVNRLANRSLLPRLLAHVIAHEIGHMLQACDRHSETGVMKARWSDSDYQTMTMKPLRFEDRDIDLIRLGVAKRQGLIASR